MKIIKLFLIALSMLTRIKLPVNLDYSEQNMKNSVGFYPTVGLLIGLIMYLLALIFSLINLNILIVSFIILFLPFFINNFFHFDGLCDVLDAFFAFKTKDKRLEIMKDPHVGSFALGYIFFFLLLKFILVYIFFSKKLDLTYLIIIPLFSRFVILLLAYRSLYPRESGTAKILVGKIPFLTLFISFLTLVISILSIFLIFKPDSLFLIKSLIILLTIAVFSFLFKLYSYRKIGGITGDVLGAGVEISEIVIFFIITGEKIVF